MLKASSIRWGFKIDARSYWSYLVSLSVILQVLVLPVVGAVADYGHRKKQYLAATAYVGAAAATAMFWLHGQRIPAGRRAVHHRQRELWRVGGGLQLVPAGDRSAGAARCGVVERLGHRVYRRRRAAGAEPAAVSERRRIGITEAMAVRISLGSAGVWWAVFTIPTLLTLRNRGAATRSPGPKRASEPPSGNCAIRWRTSGVIRRP